MIVALGEWVLHHACVEAATWPHGVKVAVNLSPIQFRDRSLALHVASALAKSGLRAQRLELEITERVLLEESDGTLAAMEQLENLGVSMSLDDFGTGYSSLPTSRSFHSSRSTSRSFADRAVSRDAGRSSAPSPVLRSASIKSWSSRGHRNRRANEDGEYAGLP